MKKWILLSISLLFASPFLSALELSGIASPYHYDESDELTSPLEDYQPFYISYIGRSGSHYLNEAKQDIIVLQLLKQADEKQMLTPLGVSLYDVVQRIVALNEGHYGELTQLGHSQLQDIGQRMLANYPEIFKGQSVNVLTTHANQAKQSAEAFLTNFRSLYPNVVVSQQPENQQTTLLFYRYSPAFNRYQNGESIKRNVRDFAKAHHLHDKMDEIASRFFAEDFLKELAKGRKVPVSASRVNTEVFIMSLFALYQETLAFPDEQVSQYHLSLDEFFTQEDKLILERYSSCSDYMTLSLAFNINGIQTKIAAPLLIDIINKADLAIQQNNIDADLRFAHVGTIAPLATLLVSDMVRYMNYNIVDYYKSWPVADLFPMAANMQLVFYRSKTLGKPILIKLLLNEKEVRLPVATPRLPYYEWEKVKTFYITKLVTMDIDVDKSAMSLLRQLQ